MKNILAKFLLLRILAWVWFVALLVMLGLGIVGIVGWTCEVALAGHPIAQIGVAVFLGMTLFVFWLYGLIKGLGLFEKWGIG